MPVVGNFRATEYRELLVSTRDAATASAQQINGRTELKVEREKLPKSVIQD